MLEVQQFLRSGNGLRQLYQRYDIESFISAPLGVCVLNYKLLSPMERKIVQESRALVLELDTWEVVGKSIDAFFSPEQEMAKPVLDAFDWQSAKAVRKMDGTLVLLYHYKGEWRVATRLSADGKDKATSMNATPHSLTWEELVKLTLKDMGTSWDEFTSRLDPAIYYSFELCTPENRCIVIYPERKLFFFAAVDAQTLQEIDIDTLDFPVLRPPTMPVESLKAVWDYILAHDNPYDMEGFVVMDKEFRRLKLTNPKYKELLYQFSARTEEEALRQLKLVNMAGYVVCMEEESQIELAGGAVIPMKELRVGQKVASEDETLQTVTRVERHTDIPLMRVIHERGQLVCSRSHRFASMDGESMLVASELQLGDKLKWRDGSPTAVTALELLPTGNVISITIEPSHLYVADGVWMHNNKSSTIWVDDTLINSLDTNLPEGLSLFDSFIARTMSMGRWVQDAHLAITPESPLTPEVQAVWPLAFDLMSQGKSMSEVLSIASEDEIYQAVLRYEQAKGVGAI